MFLIAFLIWSSNFEGCIGRRGKHWRENRDSLLKKKGKNHNGGGSKPKAPPQKSIPPPQLQPPPPSQEGAPSTPPPPPKNNNGGSSAIFNVLDFGAKGHGDTDDTKVNSTLNFNAHRNWF